MLVRNRNVTFSSEAEMTPRLLRSATEYLDPRETHAWYRTEYQWGSRIVDLVMVGYRESLDFPSVAHAARRLERLPRVSLDLLGVLAASAPTRKGKILNQTGMSEEQLIRHLRRLVKAKLAYQTQNGWLRPTQWLAVLPSDVAAIELKLIRWQQAIEQARQHLSWADYAYVALPARVAGRNEVVEACAARGVGLIAVDERVTEIVVRAVRSAHERAVAVAARAAIIRDIAAGRAWQSLRGERDAGI